MKNLRKLLGLFLVMCAFVSLACLPVPTAYAATETVGIWENEYYYIKNVASGLYLDVNSSTEYVRIASFTGGNNQKWKFKQKG